MAEPTTRAHELVPAFLQGFHRWATWRSDAESFQLNACPFEPSSWASFSLVAQLELTRSKGVALCLDGGLTWRSEHLYLVVLQGATKDHSPFLEVWAQTALDQLGGPYAELDAGGTDVLAWVNSGDQVERVAPFPVSYDAPPERVPRLVRVLGTGTPEVVAITGDVVPSSGNGPSRVGNLELALSGCFPGARLAVVEDAPWLLGKLLKHPKGRDLLRGQGVPGQDREEALAWLCRLAAKSTQDLDLIAEAITAAPAWEHVSHLRIRHLATAPEEPLPPPEPTEHGVPFPGTTSEPEPKKSQKSNPRQPPGRQNSPPAEPGVPGASQVAPALVIPRPYLLSELPAPGPEPQELLRGLLPARGLAQLYGVPKSGKSTVALSLAFHVAMGESWLGHECRLPGRVAYIANEGRRGIENRARAFVRHFGHKAKRAPVYLIPGPLALAHPGVRAGLAERLLEKLEGEAAPWRLVVIDTQAHAYPDADENNARDMGAFAHQLSQLGEALGALVLCVHHSTKAANSARGSSAFGALLDAQLHVERKKNGRSVALVAARDARDDAEPMPILLQEVELADGLESVVAIAPDAPRPANGERLGIAPAVRVFLRAEPKDAGKRLLALVHADEPCAHGRAKVAELLDIPPSKARSLLERAAKLGLLEEQPGSKAGSVHRFLSTEGREALGRFVKAMADRSDA